MTRRTTAVLVAAAGLAALGGGGVAIAGASGNERDRPIIGSALQRARSVALDRVGGGHVTGTELGDEEGAYEVEITRADGSSVDVHLDSRFSVIDVSPDGPADNGDSHGN
jgi:hypothetical protein